MIGASTLPGLCRGRRDGPGRLLRSLDRAMDHALEAETLAGGKGFLQGLDPRIKLVGLLALLVTATLLTSLIGLAGLFTLTLALAAGSRIPLGRLARQAWVPVLMFTGCIALPSLVTVPGEAVARLPLLSWDITLPGLRSAAFLVGRATTAATLGLLLILSTPWPHVLKALRCLGVPVVVVAILGMTHRTIFLLLQTATQIFEARRSRTVGPMDRAAQRRMIVAGTGVLLARTFQLATETHLAMVARGYRGEVHLLDDFRARPRDLAALAGALAIPAVVLWLQW
ncbi:Nickel transport protein NikQ [Rhodovastum atsumiense]|uniref:Cobalt ECF transporter T component CbiQ n=1 Tax=Rhodovastum atsumiense TaxID=504468 RepID=A0A5M6IX02_9PROT|nr:cobalt ECF transporter T component CbiQ [Rhodovastum atsumiense]KAA5612856.1 cobalt ECF transporter T component CbiQ [Rhodovastum atsumiense]CAH2601076.1 Nickel transport protein NikQ [Rhodovastum atsumiense]